MCGAEREDLKRLMLWCLAYTQERRKSERLQQPYPKDDVIGQYLFENKFIEKTKRTLHTFWKIREKKMKEKKTGKETASENRKKDPDSENRKKIQPEKNNEIRPRQ